MWNQFVVITHFQEIDFSTWISSSSIFKIWHSKIGLHCMLIQNQNWHKDNTQSHNTQSFYFPWWPKLLVLGAVMYGMEFCCGVPCALFDMNTHTCTPHLHTKYTTVVIKKLMCFCSEKGWLTANIIMFSSGLGSCYRPSSMEYRRILSTLASQTHEGPSYQTWHSPSK